MFDKISQDELLGLPSIRAHCPPSTSKSVLNDYPESSKGFLKILYTNADTLTNKMDELKLLTRDESPDVIAVNEVLPKKSMFLVQEQELQIDGFNMVSNLEATSRTSIRGLVLYINNNFTYTVKELDNDFQEYIFIDVILFTGSVVSIGLIYRSPNSSYQNNILLLKVISEFCETSKDNLIILGDFNLPRIDWANNHTIQNSYEEEFLGCLMDNYLHQHVSEPTRSRSRQRENVLDLVITKDEDLINNLNLMSPLGKSDHLVLRVIVNEPTTYHATCQEKKFKFYEGDYDSMKDKILNYNWEEFFMGKSANQCWEVFRDLIISLQEEFIPVTKAVLNPKPGWMNKNVRSALRSKQRAWKKYMMCRSVANFGVYKLARNKLKQITQNARKDFEMKIVDEIKVSPKSFWKFVNKKTKQSHKVCRVRDHNGNLTKSNKDTAESLNMYFSTVFNEHDIVCSSLHSDWYGETMSGIIFKEEEILQVLKELKIDKAAGPDRIHPRVLFELRYLIAKPLRIIFDKSLSTSSVPSDWKKACVVPIFKKGKKDLPQNYRPVSLTCIVCKIMEKIIRDNLMKFLTQNDLLSDSQFGFVPGRSCTLQLLVCIEKWTKQFDEGNNVDIIYTDFSKAFDVVSHSKLITKIFSTGITGEIGNWIKDFLSNRYQRVRIQDSFSSWIPVKSGVPQGSVLGPVLFLLYINDLPKALHENIIELFADDAKLNKSISSGEDAAILQANFNRMVSWSDKWSLKLNTKKCKVLHISKSSDSVKQSYYMNSPEGPITLDEVEYEKDLGVYIDSKLSFETHVNNSVKLANKMTGIIKRNFKFMGDQVFLNLYKTLVRPHLEYSCVVWDPITLRDQRLVEGVQRRATKLIPNMQSLNYEQRLVNLGLPSLQYRRMRADMIQVYKIVTGVDRVDPNMFFEFAKSSRTRGHKYKLCKPRCKTSFRRHVFSHRVVDIWNSLSSSVVEAPDINSFKTRLNTFWKDHPIKFTPSFY